VSVGPRIGTFAVGELAGRARRALDAKDGLRGRRDVIPFPRAGERLTGTVAVLSAHLDDAVFSLGANIAAAGDVRVITVLAGDPDSREPAGKWDEACGFTDEGDAARQRREEDRRACELLGAEPVWLPFRDHQYEPRADWAEIRDAVAQAVEGAGLVLVPGAPLTHEDHIWLTRGVIEAGIARGARLGLYLEQPYAIWTDKPAAAPAEIERLLGGPALTWTATPIGRGHRRLKARACAAYASQISGLTPTLIYELAKYESRRGGEAIAWTAP
jgi:LmbE family N-acetylglucosaminyl deacetylase